MTIGEAIVRLIVDSMFIVIGGFGIGASISDFQERKYIRFGFRIVVSIALIVLSVSNLLSA